MPVSRWRCFDRARDRDAGVVHQQVEPLPCNGEIDDGIADHVAHGDVGGPGCHAGGTALAQPHHRYVERRLVDVEHAEMPAVARQQLRHGETQSTRGAGDERALCRKAPGK
jgi:hypothetical protein